MHRSRTSPVRRLLVAGGAALVVVSVGSCRDDPVSSDPPSRKSETTPIIGSGDYPARFGFLSGHLPSTDTVTSSVPAFEIKQKGGGIAGRFEISNPSSVAIALDGVNGGSGHALLAWNYGLGRAAEVITTNSGNTLPALDVSSQSLGTGTLGSAMNVVANNPNTSWAAVRLSGRGTGAVLVVDHLGTKGTIAAFRVAGVNKIRFARNGRGYFNGGTQTGGADVAEAFAVEGSTTDYASGDVLAVSEDTDRTVEKSDEPYSTRIVGVYATRPGVLLTERDIDERLDDLVPLGVIGVIPTKVSAENGAIRRGDLLVSASLPGHAMRADPDRLRFGTVLGKSLQDFAGPGTGRIQVLVNVK
jgi:hypothetical protein